MLLCPTCQASGQRSTVRIVPGKPPTQVPKDEYFDERGEWHSHNPTIYRTRYRCSNGHPVFEEISSWECWCGYKACEAKINVLGAAP